MVLTPHQKLKLLYPCQDKPACADYGLADQGIMGQPEEGSKISSTSLVVKQRLRSWPEPTQIPPGTGDQDDDIEIEDEYFAACAATFAKPGNVITNGKISSHQKTNSKNRSHAKPVEGENSVGASHAKKDHKYRHDPPIPSKDEFGNPLVCQFCTLALVVIFPYKFISKDSSDRVAKRFFDGGKIWQYGWEIHYIYPPSDVSDRPILLVPLSQFQTLIDEINTHYKGNLVIPTDLDLGLVIPFYDDRTPQPIFLGHGKDREHISEMEVDIPVPNKNHGKTPAGADEMLDRSFAAFKKKMEVAADANKRKSKTLKKKRVQDRVVQQREWCRSLKRAQRYLGLRPRIENPRVLYRHDPNMPWAEQQHLEQEYAITSGRALQPLDVNKPAPHPFDQHPIIISLDIESNERNHDQVTEVGVSTLDTLDLEGIAPGDGGRNWMAHIRSRHFRIAERMYIVNKDFCPGNPDKFLFGQSEEVPITKIGMEFDKCFQWPFSAYHRQPGTFETDEGAHGEKLETEFVERGLAFPSTEDSTIEGEPRIVESTFAMEKIALVTQKEPLHRKIVLVGHDLASDIHYLRILPSTILDPNKAGPDGDCIYSFILEALDTTDMQKVLHRETISRNLGHLLLELGIPGWELHNAGNDARYTLEAFIGIAIKDRLNEDKRKTSTEKEKEARAAVWEAELQQRINEKQQEAEDHIRTDAAIWEMVSGERYLASQNSNSEEPGDHTTRNVGMFAPWLLEVDPVFQDDDDQDGGEPKGWNVEPQRYRKTSPSKKTKNARKQEADQWFNDYLKEQIAKQMGVEEEPPMRGGGWD